MVRSGDRGIDLGGGERKRTDRELKGVSADSRKLPKTKS